MTTIVFSIGYQGLSAKSLCERLAAEGVQALVDVRARAWSHRPEFRKTALSNKLAEYGIDYIHCRDAGNPFRPTRDRPISFDECSVLYREHIRQASQALDQVRGLVESGLVALFCYEHQHCDCHRSVLVEELAELMPGLQHRRLE